MFAVKKILMFLRRMFPPFILFFLLTLISGCQAAQGVKTYQLPGEATALSRIGVLPFHDFTPTDQSVKMTSCPICGETFQTEKLADSAEKIVGELVLTSLRRFKQYTFVNPDQTAEVYERYRAAGTTALPELVSKTGKELNVDAILVGFVFRYRERKGYPYSVEKPASVAFDLHLIRVKDGLTIWRGSFDKTQSSLMEDVFQVSSFFSGGGKWVTAKELATEGLPLVLKTFPGVNEKK